MRTLMNWPEALVAISAMVCITSILKTGIKTFGRR